MFRDWRPYLSPGEIGTIKVIATDRKQARTIHRYCRALLTRVPVLKQLVAHDSDDEIELRNGITIEIQSASFRSVRGYTVIACLADELAFWRTDEGSANPDAEILAAIRPAMATIPGAMLLCASSPYARRGELWNAFRRYHGKDDAPALVWQAATRVMNATVPQRLIDDELERDPARGASEYLAEFRTDIETFVPREVVDALVVPGRFQLPRISGVNYFGFFDAAGGSGGDSFVSAIGHLEGTSGIAVLDAMIERRPPFTPSETVDEHAALFKSFGVREIVGDRWAGEFPAEGFRKHGISVNVSARVKSDIYREALPMLTSGRVELLDVPRLAAQLVALERRTARGGKDSIDHAPGQHDDLVNAALGVLLLAATEPVSIGSLITPEVLERARRPSLHMLRRRLDGHYF